MQSRTVILLAMCLCSLLASAQNSFVAISVPDADASAKWYADTLGFKEVRRSEAPDGLSRAVIMESKYGMLEIVQHKDAVPLSKLKPGTKGEYEVQGIFKAGYFVTGIDDLYSSLKKRKVQFVGELYEDRPLHLKSFIIRDNSGTIVQFLERTPVQAVK